MMPWVTKTMRKRGGWGWNLCGWPKTVRFDVVDFVAFMLLRFQTTVTCLSKRKESWLDCPLASEGEATSYVISDKSCIYYYCVMLRFIYIYIYICRFIYLDNKYTMQLLKEKIDSKLRFAWVSHVDNQTQHHAGSCIMYT